jgi:hypothetical protein
MSDGVDEAMVKGDKYAGLRDPGRNELEGKHSSLK